MDQPFSYDAWITAQATQIARAVATYTASGMFNEAVYLVPATETEPGRLMVDHLPHSLEVVRFGGHGSRVASVPISHLWSMLWDACRRLPIIPRRQR